MSVLWNVYELICNEGINVIDDGWLSILFLGEIFGNTFGLGPIA